MDEICDLLSDIPPSQITSVFGMNAGRVQKKLAVRLVYVALWGGGTAGLQGVGVALQGVGGGGGGGGAAGSGVALQGEWGVALQEGGGGGGGWHCRRGCVVLQGVGVALQGVGWHCRWGRGVMAYVR